MSIYDEKKRKSNHNDCDLDFGGHTDLYKSHSLCDNRTSIETMQDSPGKQRVTLEYGQAVPYALTDTAFLGGFQPRLDFLNALGRLHGVHGVF